ncbi:MAG: DUF1287 domain-containing protein [Acidobacteria bacterium]|nr:DUF1287 domain-containing protein [Acidobacteriota bacterium]MBV9477076.1 DUF1287 domain-containing protein [Acidobacteriota bacterium]
MLTRRILTFALLTLALQAGASQRDAFVAAAKAQVGVTRAYDPAYRQLAYPGGDIPLSRGVCSDVVIRAMRKAGYDLQVLVHEDMRAHFDAYPRKWGLRKPDANIDHRRVPNLATFFTRQGRALPVTRDARDYAPGDIVTWRLASGVPHIGVVSDVAAGDTSRRMVVHNIGWGAQLEDVLFAYELTGHYRWFR